MQADLRHCLSHIPNCWKSHAVAHIISIFGDVYTVELLISSQSIGGIHFIINVVSLCK